MEDAFTYQHMDLSRHIEDREEVMVEHQTYGTRRYSLYRKENQTLVIVRFPMGLLEFISINDNVIPLPTFLQLKTITERSMNEINVVEISFAGVVLTLYDCSVALCIRAFSEVVA